MSVKSSKIKLFVFFSNIYSERNKKENEEDEAGWGALKKAGARRGTEQAESEKIKLKHVEKDKEAKKATTYATLETVNFFLSILKTSFNNLTCNFQDANYSDLDDIEKRRRAELEQYIKKPADIDISDDNCLMEKKSAKSVVNPEDADLIVKTFVK